MNRCRGGQPNLTLGDEASCYGGPSGSEYAPLGRVASWQVDARIYSHLFVAASGPLPGSEADIDPQLACPEGLTPRRPSSSRHSGLVSVDRKPPDDSGQSRVARDER